MNFLDSLSNFIFDTIIYISNSTFGYIIGGFILISSLFVLVYSMAARRY